MKKETAALRDGQREMKIFAERTTVRIGTTLSLLFAICECTNRLGAQSTKTYVLTVESSNPSSGVEVAVSPADNKGDTKGATKFTRTYNTGTSVTLTAPAKSGSNMFASWTGCKTTSTVTCRIVLSANTTVTANYGTQVRITPTPASVMIGENLQFTATVIGPGNLSNAVTWSLTGPSGSNLSPGTLSSTGLYTTPYPAPSKVTVKATSNQDSSFSASVTFALVPPPARTGPALTVDVGNQTHPISPYIYGMNAYVLDTNTATTANIAVTRWGGDNTSRYNYQNNTSNSASDWYFENSYGSGGLWPDGTFEDLVTIAASHGIKTLGTVPVLGWVTNSSTSACSFTLTEFPDQQSYDGTCGNGIDSNGNDLVGNAKIAAITSISMPPPSPPAPSAVNHSWAAKTWAGGWVDSLVSKSETAASGGVAIWDLDNEPAWWDAVHRDVHPNPSTYDEVTNGGIGTALAIKTADPAAEVSGPVIDYWWNYFYSKKDIENGWSSGPCYEPWQNPIDRQAHGGVPMIEYYLQRFKDAETTYGMRLLDYVDLHTYFAADYQGSSVAFTTAGDTGAQQARLNSTRVFWDPTYTDPNYNQPNYITDPNYTSNCNVPLQAPQLIPMMQTWIANNYPGTKTAIDEYNFGGMEAINGAITQADILGIFGREGLDLATLWPTTNYSEQVPGTMAFAMYRNYDGAKSTFGEMALASSSTDQSQLSVYSAQRTADGAITVIVINKTYGALSTTLSLENLTAPPGTTAQIFQYSNANLNTIVAAPAVKVTPPAAESAASTVGAAFPAQSITLLVVPKQ